MGTNGDQSDYLCRIIAELQKSSMFLEMRADLQKEVGKPHIHVSDMKQSIVTYLRDSGWEVKLQNTVYSLLTSSSATQNKTDIPRNQLKEPLAFLRKAQINWEKRIVKSINTMCTELSLPLARERSSTDRAHMASKFEILGGELDEKEMEKIKPVYAPKDFFEALIGIENPTFTPLPYKELDAANLHSGVDDALLESSSTDSFPAEWNKLGRKVIQQGSALAARQYAKYGCPPGLRRDLWKLILCYEVDDVDIKLTAANDDNYFVFEDVLCQALLVFSRDTSVLKHFDQSSATPPKSYIRGKLGVQDYAVVYPPNGFIPFHGFSLYAAPLGFVCSHAPQLYYLFKQIYTRLRLAFNWLIYAFAGYLDTEQLLLLWDRIFAYDSMELLAVLAMAILSYRRANLLEVTNLQAAQDYFVWSHCLKLPPLCQKMCMDKGSSSSELLKKVCQDKTRSIYQEDYVPPL
ncbi:TBC1 domain family member 19 [Acropora cervicornis]|uniref:TBC1 domain family member 19 n=1 Tax=Acropora cervicornis TaxID=6130 RepID=A0AAD9QKU7_ACRCE|nr:TBC1 domain family member 19 [Acropora cervicornis]